jgi:CRISPR-associated protein Cmr6
MYPYSGSDLIQLLEQQHQKRSQAGLFKKGVFTLPWRTKVGSFPHPDQETLVSAGEPCGSWCNTITPSNPLLRPESKRFVAKSKVGGKWIDGNWESFKNLPLYGYIPASSIRGIVRAWACKRPEIKTKMIHYLGFQDQAGIHAGCVEFLDAWPQEPTQLTLDIVNPQQEFQVFHEGSASPLSLYTLGNGKDSLEVTVAIRGIPGRITPEELEEVWSWVEQALVSHGVGSRTASGYGMLTGSVQSQPDPGWKTKEFDFALYSQGCAGPHTQGAIELRPSHWRGWLRSWLMRFLLGVMSKEDAQTTVNELLGSLEDGKGLVRLQMIRDCFAESKEPKFCTWKGQLKLFYTWKGQLKLSAPEEILQKIILPVVQCAVTVGGLGRGWRRPLHIFVLTTPRGSWPAARGSHLALTHRIKDQRSNSLKTVGFNVSLKPTDWDQVYQNWLEAAQDKWPERIQIGINDHLEAEVFSPRTVAIYALPGPKTDPLDKQKNTWAGTDPISTRGEGMNLIYQDQHPRNYKRHPDLGGNAAQGEVGRCSWVSIRRLKIPHTLKQTDCQEIVCLFMGEQDSDPQHIKFEQANIRTRFLRDLHSTKGSTHLFGLQP